MPRICVEADVELHKSIKKKAIDTGETLKEYVKQLIEKDVGEGKSSG